MSDNYQDTIQLESAFERSSFPVLSFDDRDRPKVVATCTLVWNDKSSFLINAGHTLGRVGTDKHRPIFVCLPGNTVELPLALKSSSSQYDRLDIAVTPLTGKFGRYFDGLDGFPLGDTFPKAKPKNSKERIMVFGYPASQSDVDVKRGEINAKATLLTLIEAINTSEKNLLKENFDLNIHIIADFPIRKMRRKEPLVIAAPVPHGMSGGPVFRAYVRPGEKEDQFIIADFIGISTDYVANFSWIKATKKMAILDFIQQM